MKRIDIASRLCSAARAPGVRIPTMIIVFDICSPNEITYLVDRLWSLAGAIAAYLVRSINAQLLRLVRNQPRRLKLRGTAAATTPQLSRRSSIDSLGRVSCGTHSIRKGTIRSSTVTSSTKPQIRQQRSIRSNIQIKLRTGPREKSKTAGCMISMARSRKALDCIAGRRLSHQTRSLEQQDS